MSATARIAARATAASPLRRGLIVALLGPDGAGKTTLAEGLTREGSLRARRVYLGTNRAAGDVLAVHAWASRRRDARGGGALGALTRPALRAFAFLTHIAEQRYRHLVALAHRARGGVVVFDRYALDLDVNVALGRTPAGWRRRLRDWLLHAGAPRPDLVLVLDAPGAVLHARKGEHSPERLEAMRHAYAGLQARHPGVVLVDAARGADVVLQTAVALLGAHRAASHRAASHRSVSQHVAAARRFTKGTP